MGRRIRNIGGFTLIELLVVIAIIAILAAILFPVFAQARKQARKANSTSVAKQMATSLLMYAQDYDEAFCLPFNYVPQQQWSWSQLCAPYYKNAQMVTDPADVADCSWTYRYSNGRHTLLYNNALFGRVPTVNGRAMFSQATSGSVTLAEVISPAECMMTIQGYTGQWGGIPDNDLPDWTGDTSRTSKFKGYNNIMIPWGTLWVVGRPYFAPSWIAVDRLPIYEDGTVVSFTDGHVKFIKVLGADGNPIIESTLPFRRHVDPQQRGLDLPTAAGNCWAEWDCWL